MDRDAIIARLRAAETELRARGVKHAALFGSRARGDDRADSDTDILLDFEPGSDLSVFEYVSVKRFVAGLLEGPVDVIDRAGLKAHVRPPAEGEAIYAF